MNIISKTLAAAALTILFGALLEEAVQAQGAGTAQINQFRSRYSTRQYTTDNIRNQLNSRSRARVGVPGVNLRVFSPSSPSKPFKGLNRGPTVSPYLALSGSLNGVSDYYNIVRPQQRQSQQNSRVQRQLAANRHRLNQIAAAGPYDLRGDPDLAPTGHAATYMFFDNFQSTGNYYPAPQGLTKER